MSVSLRITVVMDPYLLDIETDMHGSITLRLLDAKGQTLTERAVRGAALHQVLNILKAAAGE